MKFIINDQMVLLRAPEGPLAPYIASFSKWAIEQGYALLLAATASSDCCGFQSVARREVGPIAQRLISTLRRVPAISRTAAADL